MTHIAKGRFEVSMKPQLSDEPAAAVTLGRMLLEKTFSGDLAATGQGQMLTAMTPTKGSAGYVAIERVSGTLQVSGASLVGSFVLQHSGTMNQGVPQLSVTVVPDSGTDALVGISGQLRINIVDGQHFYEFDFTL